MDGAGLILSLPERFRGEWQQIVIDQIIYSLNENKSIEAFRFEIPDNNLTAEKPAIQLLLEAEARLLKRRNQKSYEEYCAELISLSNDLKSREELIRKIEAETGRTRPKPTLSRKVFDLSQAMLPKVVPYAIINLTDNGEGVSRQQDLEHYLNIGFYSDYSPKDSILYWTKNFPEFPVIPVFVGVGSNFIPAITCQWREGRIKKVHSLGWNLSE